jgi:hypothetical protein
VTIEKIKGHNCGCEENPRLARTLIDDADTALPSHSLTRIHTPGSGQLKLRYVKRFRLGGGHFGEVYEGTDMDSGKAIAVNWALNLQSSDDLRIQANSARCLLSAQKRGVFPLLSSFRGSAPCSKR